MRFFIEKIIAWDDILVTIKAEPVLSSSSIIASALVLSVLATLFISAGLR